MDRACEFATRVSEAGDTTTAGRESGRLRRRIDRFRRAGLLDQTEAFVIKQAGTVEELHEAYALVHDVFVSQNYILPQPGGLRIRPFEALPEMATFVAKRDGRVVAVMSVVPDSQDLGLPSDKAFKPELDELRRQGRYVCECTNLAVAPDCRNTAVFLELTRCCVAHGLNAGYDDGFISISSGHAMFFEAVMGFEQFGARRDYGDRVLDFVEGMRLNLHRVEAKMLEADRMLGEEAFLHDWFFQCNPHFELARRSVPEAAARFLDPELLRSLLVDQTGFLSECDEASLGALRRRWGSDVYSMVMGSDQRACIVRSAAA